VTGVDKRHVEVKYARPGEAVIVIGELCYTVWAHNEMKYRPAGPFTVDGVPYRYPRMYGPSPGPNPGPYAVRKMIEIVEDSGGAARMRCNNPPNEYEINQWVRGDGDGVVVDIF
jgi:hypothetical protein